MCEHLSDQHSRRQRNQIYHQDKFKLISLKLLISITGSKNIFTCWKQTRVLNPRGRNSDLTRFSDDGTDWRGRRRRKHGRSRRRRSLGPPLHGEPQRARTHAAGLRTRQVRTRKKSVEIYLKFFGAPRLQIKKSEILITHKNIFKWTQKILTQYCKWRYGSPPHSCAGSPPHPQQGGYHSPTQVDGHHVRWARRMACTATIRHILSINSFSFSHIFVFGWWMALEPKTHKSLSNRPHSLSTSFTPNRLLQRNFTIFHCLAKDDEWTVLFCPFIIILMCPNSSEKRHVAHYTRQPRHTQIIKPIHTTDKIHFTPK